ncbi:hypothetical protein SKAU_G00316180 [Synaphobranchus kaupii]|uniref:Uncharacterized protein n=1 Tax=Synaphobranchus kaupii TaxID=118154 RepID=A0A9Q1IJM4_SYNKA|nr:hypothetical protein SKAU_G00316180 [Synaphobranchus kaupii]
MPAPAALSAKPLQHVQSQGSWRYVETVGHFSLSIHYLSAQVWHGQEGADFNSGTDFRYGTAPLVLGGAQPVKPPIPCDFNCRGPFSHSKHLHSQNNPRQCSEAAFELRPAPDTAQCEGAAAAVQLGLTLVFPPYVLALFALHRVPRGKTELYWRVKSALSLGDSETHLRQNKPMF